jgi:hypothetical protein
MGSGAVICISTFIKIGAGIQEVMGEIHKYRQINSKGSHNPKFIFSKLGK